MLPQPTGEEIKRVRVQAGLSRGEVAELIGLRHANRVGEFECDEAPIDNARWELLLIKCGQHERLRPLKHRKR